MGHLTGTRISALLDGQLTAAEVEQAWTHVHACHLCRDRVEREGWVKAQLAGLSQEHGAAPDRLRGSLHQLTPGERYAADPHASARELAGRADAGHGRRAVAVVGTGAASAAMLGVLALGVAPASTPTPTDRRPTGGVTQPVSTTTPTPLRAPIAVAVTVGTVSPTATGTTGSTSTTTP
ncbi:hypothetical protein KUV85_08810 [Nocardioides panacisoli]|uniref:hypothetical protein n=1 Tax=Nocardioides panacisoli TaxID=627624 RepID=UPI001C6304B5|nr:hypothetical protein [Nocardioides panacisoli]QYJ02440.1 hypothetical protein KUV85_08810 [Nocardioides panacisoli]